MSFASLIPAATVLLVIGAITAVTAVAVTVGFFAVNRQTRLSRSESLRTYYGNLVAAH